MAEETKNYMTWQDKIRAAEQVMALLDSFDLKDGNREQELCDILEIAAKLLLPLRAVRLIVDRSYGL